MQVQRACTCAVVCAEKKGNENAGLRKNASVTITAEAPVGALLSDSAAVELSPILHSGAGQLLADGLLSELKRETFRELNGGQICSRRIGFPRCNKSCKSDAALARLYIYIMQEKV